jgi:hypothetical protein
MRGSELLSLTVPLFSWDLCKARFESHRRRVAVSAEEEICRMYATTALALAVLKRSIEKTVEDGLEGEGPFLHDFGAVPEDEGGDNVDCRVGRAEKEATIGGSFDADDQGG